jgi:hypothetical protein
MVGMSAVAEALAAAIDDLAAIDLDTLTDDELDADLVALVRQRHRLDAEIARRAARWEQRDVWRSDGSRAPWARLSRTAAVAPGGAKQILRRGRAVSAMPVTGEAWRCGDIGSDHVDLLAAAAGSGRADLFARDEAVLVTHCETLIFTDVVKASAYWRHRADAERGGDGPAPQPPSSLRLHHGFDGAVSGEFELDPVGGVTVTEALRRIERDLYRADQRDGLARTITERMAAALVEMAVRAHAAPADGRRPEPLVMILAGETSFDDVCELATGVVISPDLIVPHLACADIQTFIFDGADCVLAASPQRSFRGLLRRAIQVRDRHCQHPSGCDVPITGCDVDHREPHDAGGRTEEANGELQCEAHNRHADLHHRRPSDIIAAARERRHLEHLARARLERLLTERVERPPPQAAG